MTLLNKEWATEKANINSLCHSRAQAFVYG
jgi:hypothetical protein